MPDAKPALASHAGAIGHAAHAAGDAGTGIEPKAARFVAVWAAQRLRKPRRRPTAIGADVSQRLSRAMGLPGAFARDHDKYVRDQFGYQPRSCCCWKGFRVSFIWCCDASPAAPRPRK